MTSNNSYSQGYALIIGVDQHSVPGLSLPDVKKDVDALHNILIHPERCGYPDKQVKRLLGEEATRGNILDGLAWLQDKVEEDDNATAIIYYSGHGWRNAEKQYYLIPHDTKVNNNVPRTSSALSASEFNEEITALTPQRLMVILDCCHAAGMDTKGLESLEDKGQFEGIPASLFLPNGQWIEDDSGLESTKSLEPLTKGKGRAVLSSCQAHEQSYMRKDGAMSIFTYHLIEALTGHAQPQGGDTEILVSDLLGYVHRQVPKTAQVDRSRDQHPEGKSDGIFPVALLLGGKGIADSAPAPDPLALAPTPAAAPIYNISTDSGAVITGNVDTGGGDFVGRDVVTNNNTTTHFDQRGQKVDKQSNIVNEK